MYDSHATIQLHMNLGSGKLGCTRVPIAAAGLTLMTGAVTAIQAHSAI